MRADVGVDGIESLLPVVGRRLLEDMVDVVGIDGRQRREDWADAILEAALAHGLEVGDDGVRILPSPQAVAARHDDEVGRMERQDVAVEALGGHAARVTTLREVDGWEVEVMEPAEREDGRTVGEMAAAVADAVAEHGDLPPVGGVCAEGAHLRPLAEWLPLAVKGAHAPVERRRAVVGLRVVDLGHVTSQRLDGLGCGVFLGVHLVDGDLVARGIRLTDPGVDGIEQRLPSPAAVGSCQYGRRHRRDVGRGVERHEVAVRRVGRAVEVDRAHAPVERLGLGAELVRGEFAQGCVVGVLVDAARAEDGGLGILCGREMRGPFGEELNLVHDGLVVRVPGQDWRIRERRLGRRRAEARGRRRQELRRRLMALRQQERRKDNDETREPDTDGGEVLMADAVLVSFLFSCFFS